MKNIFEDDDFVNDEEDYPNPYSLLADRHPVVMEGAVIDFCTFFAAHFDLVVFPLPLVQE